MDRRALALLATAAFALLGLVAAPLRAHAQPAGTARPVVEVELFAREGCPHCAAAHEFLDALRRERPEVRLVVHDVARDRTSREALERLARAQGIAAPGVPTIRVRDTLVTGFVSAETTGARIRAALDATAPPPPPTSQPGADAAGATCSADPASAGVSSAPCDQPAGAARDEQSVDVPLLGRIDARAVGLPAFTLVLGLLDGFNPCAMWVLLLLLSVLATLRSRAKMLAVGGTFVVVSGLVYFAFMAAWLNVFLLIGLSRVVQVALAALAVLVGAVNIKDFFAFKRGVSFSIPESAKPGIYRRLRAIVQAEHVPGAIAGATVLATLVNFVELLCTAGFPAIYTRVLTLHELPRWKYYAYLALYNVAYMADDALMLGIAVATLSRRKLQEREGRWLKLISGAVMVALGAVLLVRPGLLAGP